MKDISTSFVATGFIQVLNIATGLLAARLLLPEGRGELAAIMLWPGLIAELGNLAIYDALLYRAATGADSPRALFAAICAIVGTMSLILIAIGLVVLPYVFEGYSAEFRIIALVYLCAYLPTYLAALFTSGMFQGHLDITTWNILRTLVPVGYLGAIVIIVLAFGASVGGFAAANIAAHILAVAVGIVLLARRGWISFAPKLSTVRGLVIYGAKVHVSEVLYSLRQRLDQAVVSLWLPAADLGIYVVALTVANSPLILVMTMANVAFPKISQQSTAGGKTVVFGRYLRLSLGLALAVNVALWILAPVLVPLLFGQPFAPSVPIVNVLLIGMVPLAAKMMFAQALKAWDRSLVIGRAELIGLMVAIGLLALLLPAYGLIGVAWSLVASQLVAAALLGWSLHRNLKLPVLALLLPTQDDWRMAREYPRRVWTKVAGRHG